MSIASGVHDVSFNDGQICGYAYAGVLLQNNSSDIKIRDNTIGPKCGNETISIGNIGVSYGTGATNMMLSGNDLHTNTTEISGSYTGGVAPTGNW